MTGLETKRRSTGRGILLATVLGVGMVAGTAAVAGPLTSSLDQFVIFKNGNLFANDTFSDGVVPPSGEGNFGTGTTPMTYTGMQGGFAEAGGKLIMDSENAGVPLFRTLINATTGATIFNNTQLERFHHARANTNTQPSSVSSNGLKNTHTFDVLALYDLASLPPMNGDNYGIGLVDNFGGSGPTADRMRLSVVRSSQSGNLRVSFWRNNQTTDPDQNENFGSHGLQTGHDQIVLRLSRNDLNNNIITASYAYVDGTNVGIDISNAANLAALTFNTISTTNPLQNPLGFVPDIFNGETHTRAELRQLALDADNRFDFARLTTGSPVSISQTINTGVSASYLTFNYRFETTTGVLTVMLGGSILGTINAPGTVTDDFNSASFLVDGALLGQTGILLSLILDGPTGSQILLDSVSFQGLQNGNFATGDLSGWDVQASGDGGAGVLTIVAAVPEPATTSLLALGLLGIGAARRRRAA